MNRGESLCLELLKLGMIRVASDGNEIEVFHRGHKKWITKKRDYYDGRARYKFGNPRTTVFANRLQWILANRSPIPDGYYVDHTDGDATNDRITNLQLMSVKASHQQGNRIQADKVLEYLGRWFDFVGQHFREPETPTEQSYVEFGF